MNIHSRVNVYDVISCVRECRGVKERKSLCHLISCELFPSELKTNVVLSVTDFFRLTEGVFNDFAYIFDLLIKNTFYARISSRCINNNFHYPLKNIYMHDTLCAFSLKSRMCNQIYRHSFMSFCRVISFCSLPCWKHIRIQLRSTRFYCVKDHKNLGIWTWNGIYRVTLADGEKVA